MSKRTNTITIEVPKEVNASKDSLSVGEVATRLGLSEKTVRNRIKEGSLKATRMGRLLRIPMEEYTRFRLGKAS